MHFLKNRMKVALVLVMFAAIGLLAAPEISFAKQVEGQKGVCQYEYKYNKHITTGIYIDLWKETSTYLPYKRALKEINQMSKVEAMDRYLRFSHAFDSPKRIRSIINSIYGIDLVKISDLGAGKQSSTYPEEIVNGVKKVLEREDIQQPLDEYILSLSKVEIMDLYFQSLDRTLDGSSIRRTINQIFGTNLDGISSLEGSGVSIYSKGQWITHYQTDLFVVHTGITDIEVWVYPTEYFQKQTGLTELPTELKHKLKALGFYYNDELGTLYYKDPNDTSVPDDFKGQTLGIIIDYIKEYHQNLLPK
ncbi:hypothetical protein ACFFGV_12795 [Pontibacillus salicampi]|uniref:S-layer homology domain-containing protein n=1 Tax=Pontibacillus salicampi TaxID=1449801 RepID=A0ABV6LPY2_9BACI